jgi:NADH-quinone oxidoreductase subunit C
MPHNETVCPIDAQELADVVQALLEAGCWHLTAITALADDESIELLYHFWLYGGLTLRAHLPAGRPRIASITPIIPGAAFYEREARELFGISFSGLADSEPLFLAEDWEGEAPMGPRAHHPSGSTADDKNAEEAP